MSLASAIDIQSPFAASVVHKPAACGQRRNRILRVIPHP